VEFNSETAALITFLIGILAIFTFSRIEQWESKARSRFMEWIYRITGISFFSEIAQRTPEQPSKIMEWMYRITGVLLIAFAAYIYFAKLFD
jgi:threonine/homoserine/homoserine lactone efflux protein